MEYNLRQILTVKTGGLWLELIGRPTRMNSELVCLSQCKTIINKL